MGYIAVDPEQLKQRSNDITNGAINVEETLATLKSAVDALYAEWAGSASVEFQNLYTAFDTSGKQFQEAMSGIAITLAKAANAYDQNEADLQKMFAF